MDPTRKQKRGGVGLLAILFLPVLIALPAYALSELATSVDWRLLVGAAVGMSGLTFLTYRTDKRRAEAGEWRIPESTLHLWDLLGGWPGGFLAQRIFRHKTSKTCFQVFFWGIIVLHQVVAIDSLNGWKITKTGMEWIQSLDRKQNHHSRN